MDRFNFAFSSGALAEGTNPATFRTTATITYEINGILASKAATDNVAMTITGPAVFSTPADGSFTAPASGASLRLYGVYLDAAGTFTLQPGPVVLAARLAAGTESLQFPGAIVDRCLVGAIRVQAAASTAFVPGVTDLSAAGITATYLNLATQPSQPIRS